MSRHRARLAGDDPDNHYTIRALRKSGEGLYLELQAVRVEWEDRPAVLCIVRDITDRQQAAEKLQEEKRFSETVINSLPGVFYLYDEDGRLQRWNQNMERITGFSPEELARARILDWFAPADQRMAANVFMEVFENGEAEAEIPVITPHGDKLPFHFSGRRLEIEGRTYMVGAGLDISKHKQLESALRESEKRFRYLVEKMPFGICIAVDRQIVYRNSTQEKILGKLDRKVALAEAPLPAEDLKRYLAACDTAARTKKPVDDLELRFYTHGQPQDPHHLVWMHCSIHPIDYRGQSALLIAMADLTRLKELEQQVLIREKMASLGHVAAGIAHEIRNPLSGINVLLEGIRENFQDPASAGDIQDLLDETQKASDKIARVIRRVLDFSKPSPVKMQLGSINAAVEEAVQLTRVTLNKRRIVLDQRLTPNLPRLYIDHQLIEQVMLNLINNAARAVDAQSGEKRILITNRQEKDHISVCVADSGLGISETLKAKIFNPFFTTSHEGSGIGLSLCQRIAADHGGTIEVDRSELGGAEFRLRLPLEKRRHPR
jgi:PAS domain S-box-containing protein